MLSRDRFHFKGRLYKCHLAIRGASQVVLVVKNHLPMQETHGHGFLSLGWEDPLEEGIATHPSILAWRIPWTQEPGGLQSLDSQRVRPN